MRADTADGESGPTQVILWVRLGLFSGGREGPQLQTKSAGLLCPAVREHFWQLVHERVATFVQLHLCESVHGYHEEG